MYKRVIIYVDSSPSSLAVGKIALKIAEHLKSRLYIFSVISKLDGKENVSKIEHSVKSLFYEAIHKNIIVEEQIETGSFNIELKKKIRRDEIDLVIFPLSERTISNALKNFLKDNLTNICLIKITNFGKIYPKHILLPIKSQIEHLNKLADFITILAETFRSDLTLLNTKSKETNSIKDIDSLIAHLEKKNIHYHLKISQLSISKAIILEVSSRKNDLIVMGYTSRGLLKSLIFGNPLYDIIHTPPSNLIVFKPV